MQVTPHRRSSVVTVLIPVQYSAYSILMERIPLSIPYRRQSASRWSLELAERSSRAHNDAEQVPDVSKLVLSAD